MSKLLIDTSVIIDFLRRKDKGNSLFYRLAGEDLAISVVTHTELFSGKSVWERPDIRKIIKDVLSGVNILPFTLEISEKAGYLKAKNSKSSLLDAIIAATSISHGLELVTLNIKDFNVFDGVKLHSLA